MFASPRQRVESHPELQIDIRKAFAQRQEPLLSEGGIPGLALDMSGRYLAVTPYLDRLTVWDMQTGQNWNMTWGARGGSDIAFSADSRSIYHVAWGLKIWDFRQRREIETCLHWPLIDQFATSPDGSYLIGGDIGARFYIRHITQAPCGERQISYPPFEGNRSIWAMAVHAGKHLLAVAEDDDITLWDLAQEQLLRKLRGTTPATDAVFTPDGKQLVSAASDGMIRIWQTQTGKQLSAWQAHDPGTAIRLAIDGTGRWLASGGAGLPGSKNTLKIWRLDQLPAISQHQPALSFPDAPVQIRFDSLHRFLASTDLKGRTVLWDYHLGKRMLTIQALPPPNLWVVYTPDGRFDFSPQSKPYLSWRWQGKNWPLNHFQQQYRVPGLLGRVIQSARAKS